MGSLISVLAAENTGKAVAASGWFLENAWFIWLFPAISFLLILLFGKRFPKGGSEIGIAGVGASFVFGLATAVQWISEVEGANSKGAEGEYALGDGVLQIAAEGETTSGVGALTRSITWLTNGAEAIGAGIMIDGLAVMMIFVVTLVSLLVHVYSTDYVAGDRRYTHFFAFLSLFTASMLFFVTASTTLQMLVGWELVGVCSFALIGHWWEEKPNSDAALKAFFTNRVGDMGLIIGVSILFFGAGTFDVIGVNEAALNGTMSHTVTLAAALCLTAAVMSKSGQFFLHTWLPDAMAGPTPVSALIHAATMVVAGIFMVARLYGVFFEGYSIGGSSINLLALIGGITTLVGASLAFVQNDIKRVLAYSTVSQLGYMILALGVGAWTAALFHLFTHAFFKACLFLGSGSVSHAVHSFDMKKDMGGLRQHMPHTYRTFLMGTLALAGLPIFSGFWSKDEILVGTGGWGLFGGTDGNGAYTLMLAMGMVTAALTGAYMTRVVYLTFFGEYRGHGTPHESGPRITGPLWILGSLAVVAGFINFPPGFQLVPHSWQEKFFQWVEPVGVSYFPPIKHATPSWSLAIVSVIVALIGIGAACYYYFIRVRATSPSATELTDGPTARWTLARAGHSVLVHKYYLDWFYTKVIVGFVKGPLARGANWANQHVIDRVVNEVGTRSVQVGNALYRNVDQLVVDGTVNATGKIVSSSGEELRRMQTGKVQQYAAIMFIAAAILAGIFIIVI
ncbi:MAG: NADH-quinone oxidoreductase subunit L [Acidimicrobiia bacterium]|nr:NADH-quinone oxidoreductase subunit L [Acidimicrobiia bacterium]MYC58062.1 NADH-quinone oxidoreductase subunit L [Acidimicrobiia bacterium]MYG93801.1 NADH-quinone oxidoreductase subunit L [Acidimicrobiia bacterium]MYI30765.1 NADH-quinone oxidoreductase subunit L [Acidimicrobiia bacterium]